MILKPGRYINSEWNAKHKEWNDDILKVALCFPDIYEIGMSHLGIKIVYGILNARKDILCERAFMPWPDMEAKIRNENDFLRALESGKKLNEFDVVGFSLQYEMNLVDVITMLDLGSIPVYSKDRGDDAPIVIAGGPCAFNPEVIADFIDAFVIGEAEEVILEIVKVIMDEGSRTSRCGRESNGQGKRMKILNELYKLESVYVPSISRTHRSAPICKRIVSNLDNAYFPEDPVVPYIQIVHDRIGIEIMRGCPHQCKFCQACKIFKPLRIRSVKRILEIAVESVKNTGYEEISLLSLSSGDYPYIEELSVKLEERFRPLGVKVSLPSMRARLFDNKNIGPVIKRAGLTFAPESGNDQLRSSLNKHMKNEDIVYMSNAALKSGWKKVKLYFMTGLPGETERDLDSIMQLVSHVKSVSVSISPFIPKPHSDFERQGMNSLGMLQAKEAYIKAERGEFGISKNVKIDFHKPEMSMIEAVLSRGDRSIGNVIYRMHHKGARLQAWSDFFNYRLWQEAFDECGIKPEIYLGANGKEDILPWGSIEV